MIEIRLDGVADSGQRCSGTNQIFAAIPVTFFSTWLDNSTRARGVPDHSRSLRGSEIAQESSDRVCGCAKAWSDTRDFRRAME
jgi:hypothetical protein